MHYVSVFSSIFALNQYQWFEWKWKSALAFRERGVNLHFKIRLFCICKLIGLPRLHRRQGSFDSNVFHWLLSSWFGVLICTMINEILPTIIILSKFLNLCVKNRSMQDGQHLCIENRPKWVLKDMGVYSLHLQSFWNGVYNDFENQGLIFKNCKFSNRYKNLSCQKFELFYWILGLMHSTITRKLKSGDFFFSR